MLHALEAPERDYRFPDVVTTDVHLCSKRELIKKFEEKINPASLAKLLGTYTFAHHLPREQ